MTLQSIKVPIIKLAENQDNGRFLLEHDPELFKKLTDEIWEFRTLYQGLQYRLLAFWDKTNTANTLVISTHGFIKKRSKIPDNEILKAKQLRTKYFEDKDEQLKKKKK